MDPTSLMQLSPQELVKLLRDDSASVSGFGFRLLAANEIERLLQEIELLKAGGTPSKKELTDV